MKFLNEEHERFYKDNILKCRVIESNHRALIYVLGLRENCRKRLFELYDFDSNVIRPYGIEFEGFDENDRRTIRLAFNLFSGDMPTVDVMNRKNGAEAALEEAKLYSISDVFGCISLVDYFVEALKLRFEW